MMKSGLLLFFVFTFVAFGCKSDALRLPFAENQVIVDNVIDVDEWRGARIVVVNNKIRFRMYQNTDSLYVSIDYDGPDPRQYRWAELYLHDGKQTYRLHASTQLGEQEFNGKSWSENWRWGSNRGWKAPRQQLTQSRQSTPNGGYEFVIAKNKFTGTELQIMIDAFAISTQADINDNPFKFRYPENGLALEPESWYSISF